MQVARYLLVVSTALFLGLLSNAEGHISKRVREIVQGMTLKDKAGQMVRRSCPFTLHPVLYVSLYRPPTTCPIWRGIDACLFSMSSCVRALTISLP